MQVTEKAIKTYLLTLILGHCIFAYSQKEGSNWYFGYQAGLTFNSGNPVALSKSPMNSSGGSTSISTNKGRLLLYSDGRQVWDSTHNVLSNTLLGLGGHQTVVIVPQPDSSHLYYIFTVGIPGSTSADSGSFYSEINMKLRSGLGDFISGKVNIPLVAPSCGKLTAVRHANRKDYWVITQKYNTDTVYAYLITSSGISKPVLSKTGLIVVGNHHGTGAMKVSPNGKRICSVNNSDSAFIGDFDAATGEVSNIWLFEPTWGYGLEFSSKTKFLYTIGAPYSGVRLCQYDLSAKTKQQFIASRKTIDTIFYNFIPSLQLGLDHKIYISPRNLFYLHVIKNPDREGDLAQPERNNVYLGGQIAGVGLPDMIQSYFQRKTFGIRPVCTRDTVYFDILNTYNLDSARWDFGDVASGANNVSQKMNNVYHIYPGADSFTVRLISYHKQFIDTIYETFFLNYAKPFLGQDTIVCNSQPIALIPQGNYKSYKWNTSATTRTLAVLNTGIYNIEVTDYDGCKSADTVIVKNVEITSDFSISDTVECLKNNFFVFKDLTGYKDDSRKQSIWYINDGSTLSDSVAGKTFSNAGNYIVTLISRGKSGCQDSIKKFVKVYPQSHPDFRINDSIQCFNRNSFDFINSTRDTGIIMYQWNKGMQILGTTKDITGVTFSKDSVYGISLISTTEFNCRDTLTKAVTILPTPKVDFGWDLACNRTNTNFIYTGTKPTLVTFNWSFDNEIHSSYENPSYLFSMPGLKEVKLIVTSNSGCSDTLSKEVIVRLESKADFTASDVCENDSVVFKNQSQDANSYYWKFGDGNTSQKESPRYLYHISNQSVTFNVTLLAIVSDGCLDSITKAVTVNANPNSDFTFIKTGTKIELQATQPGNSMYQWKFGSSDSVISTSDNYIHIITKPEQSKVCLKVSNIAGCESQTCKDVTLSIFDVNSKSGFNFYPNPNSGNFTFEIPNNEGIAYLEIFNQIGQLIYDCAFNSDINTLDLSLANGIYLLKISNGEITFIRRMIVSK